MKIRDSLTLRGVCALVEEGDGRGRKEEMGKIIDEQSGSEVCFCNVAS